MADAPCHGTGFHNLNDDLENNDSDISMISSFIKYFLEQKIYWHFGKIYDVTDKMIEIFNSIYISLRSKMKIETFNIDENKVPLIDFYMHIATSVQLSIRLEDTNYKEIKKIKAIPNWENIEEETVLVFKLELPENDENLFRMISDKKIPKFSVKKRTFKIAPFPFDNGSTNCAYYSLATTFQPELNVFKQFMDEKKRILENYKAEVAKQTISSYLAKIFNHKTETLRYKKF